LARRFRASFGGNMVVQRLPACEGTPPLKPRSAGQTGRMPIDYRGTVTRPLFVKCQWLHLGWRSLILLAFPAVFIVLIAIGWNQSGSAPFAKRIEAVAITFLWPVFMLAFFYWQWLRVYKRSPYLREPLWGSVSEEGLEVHGANGDSKLPWNLFIKQRRSKNLILLYQSPVMFNILAREFFASEEAWQSAWSLVSSRLSKPPLSNSA
jgi:YcxB-like protein